MNLQNPSLLHKSSLNLGNQQTNNQTSGTKFNFLSNNSTNSTGLQSGLSNLTNAGPNQIGGTQLGLGQTSLIGQNNSGLGSGLIGQNNSGLGSGLLQQGGLLTNNINSSLMGNRTNIGGIGQQVGSSLGGGTSLLGQIGSNRPTMGLNLQNASGSIGQVSGLGQNTTQGIGGSIGMNQSLTGIGGNSGLLNQYGNNNQTGQNNLMMNFQNSAPPVNYTNNLAGSQNNTVSGGANLIGGQNRPTGLSIGGMSNNNMASTGAFNQTLTNTNLLGNSQLQTNSGLLNSSNLLQNKTQQSSLVTGLSGNSQTLLGQQNTSLLSQSNKMGTSSLLSQPNTGLSQNSGLLGLNLGQNQQNNNSSLIGNNSTLLGKPQIGQNSLLSSGTLMQGSGVLTGQTGQGQMGQTTGMTNLQGNNGTSLLNSLGQNNKPSSSLIGGSSSLLVGNSNSLSNTSTSLLGNTGSILGGSHNKPAFNSLLTSTNSGSSLGLLNNPSSTGVSNALQNNQGNNLLSLQGTSNTSLLQNSSVGSSLLPSQHYQTSTTANLVTQQLPLVENTFTSSASIIDLIADLKKRRGVENNQDDFNSLRLKQRIQYQELENLKDMFMPKNRVKEYDSSAKTFDLLARKTVPKEKVKFEIFESEKKEKLNNCLPITERVKGLSSRNKPMRLAEVADPEEADEAIELTIKLQQPVKLSFTLVANKLTTLRKLKLHISEKLKENEDHLFKQIRPGRFFLMKNSTVIQGDDLELQTLGIEDKDTFYLIVREEDKLEVTVPTEKQAVQKRNIFVDEEQLPILVRPGYKMIPDFVQMCRMQSEDLKSIQNFTIYNDYGKMVFPGFTDVTNMNLDQIVTIEERCASAYVGQAGESFAPSVGEGLNKQCIITIHRNWPSGQTGFESEEQYIKYLEVLKKAVKKYNAEFLSFNRENGDFKFKVQHF